MKHKTSLTKPPRVLFLYDFPLSGGGSGAYVKYLALRLVEKYGYRDRVGIALPDQEVIDPRIQMFPLSLPQVPVFIGRPGLESSKRYVDLSGSEISDLYHAYINGTMHAVESFKPEIIHVHHVSVNAWAARYIRSMYGTKYIVTSHGSCIHAISKDRRYLPLSRDALNASSAITVVSGDTRAKLLKMFGTQISSKTRTIPGGVKMSLFPTERNTQQLRKSLGIGDQKMALFTGRLISEKGVEYLVKAAARIRGYVVIAGDGPQRGAIEKMIHRMKLTNVKMLGYMGDVKKFIELYYLADVFVSPAVWDEPLGLTTLEAMASKTPPVVTRKGGTVMAIKEGINGMFVRPRSSDEIAHAVNYLFERDKKRLQMGENARKVVEEKFTWSEIAGRFDHLYRRVAL